MVRRFLFRLQAYAEINALTRDHEAENRVAAAWAHGPSALPLLWRPRPALASPLAASGR